MQSQHNGDAPLVVHLVILLARRTIRSRRLSLNQEKATPTAAFRHAEALLHDLQDPRIVVHEESSR